MSGDELPPATWGAGVDAEAMSRLRLDKGREALEQGDPGLALVEAEELLDGDPAHEEALWLAAEAAFELGANFTAVAALEPLLAQRPMAAEAWSLLSRCRLEGMELEEAEQAARRCLALSPERAHDEGQAWFVLGIIGRQRGEPDFKEALRRAADRDPGCFAPRQPSDPAAWRAALPKALLRLPPSLRSLFASISIELRSFPANDDLELRGVPLSPLVPCQMLAPHPPPELPPARIALYTDNLHPDSPEDEDLARSIVWALSDLAGLWAPLDLDLFSEE